MGANLIITHEPIFYNHRDSTDWLSHHLVYVAKRRLVEENRLVIWRFHGYLHSLPPDSTVMGLVEALNWESDQLLEQPYMCHIQPMTLLELGQLIKQRLNLPTIRVLGDMAMRCERVGVLPGFPPVEFQIGSLGETNVDVLIAGEVHEWEVCEYVRDATHLGFPKGLIVIGHAASEEPGMRRIIPWLEERFQVLRFTLFPRGARFGRCSHPPINSSVKRSEGKK